MVFSTCQYHVKQDVLRELIQQFIYMVCGILSEASLIKIPFSYIAPCNWLVAILAFCSVHLAYAKETNNQFTTVIPYCVDPNWMPYEAIRNGKHVGISADYINEISNLTNIKFELIPTETWQQTLSILKDGKCQLTSLLNKTPQREKFLDFTDHYFNSANVFITADRFDFIPGYENLDGYKVGVVKDYRHAEYIATYHPKIELVEVASESDGLLRLKAGKLDVFVGSMLSATSHIQKFGLDSLKIVGLAKPHDSLAMGVIKGHPELVTILNHAIANIPESTHVDIFKQWNNVKIIDEIDYRFLWAILFVFFVTVVAFLWRNHYVVKFNRTLMEKNDILEALQSELMEKNEKLEFLSTHDQLTGLHNRHFMLSCCNSEMLRIKRLEENASLIIFDIDHFKLVNDSQGHSFGDDVLVAIANVVKRAVREIDVIARWGGEEFLILCPNTTLLEANGLAFRLAEAIRRDPSSKMEDVTCSFGVAEYKQGESFVEWFDRSDSALYRAKEAGRNTIMCAD